MLMGIRGIRKFMGTKVLNSITSSARGCHYPFQVGAYADMCMIVCICSYAESRGLLLLLYLCREWRPTQPLSSWMITQICPFVVGTWKGQAM
jgi:hypothetical protein